MSPGFSTHRPARYAFFAVVSAAALSVAACGSSNNASPTTTSPLTGPASASTPAAAPGQGRDRVAGLIASVSGMTAQVTQQGGNAAVGFGQSTKVSEVTQAQFSDVRPGSCIAVRPTRNGGNTGGAMTAQSVLVSPAVNGQCTQPGGRRGGGSRTAPSPAHPAGGRGVQGTVASVNGNTIVVSNTAENSGNSQTNVTVDNATTYAKRTSADTQAIAAGKCMAATGTKDSSGALQATAVNLRPANNGTCPQPGGRRHGG